MPGIYLSYSTRDLGPRADIPTTATAKSTARAIAVLSLQVQPPLRPRQLEALPQPLELGIASHA